MIPGSFFHCVYIYIYFSKYTHAESPKRYFDPYSPSSPFQLIGHIRNMSISLAPPRHWGDTWVKILLLSATTCKKVFLFFFTILNIFFKHMTFLRMKPRKNNLLNGNNLNLDSYLAIWPQSVIFLFQVCCLFWFSLVYTIRKNSLT